MHAALLYRRGETLTDAELSALRLDGLLFEVGDCYLPADVPETAEARLLTIAPLLRDDLVVSGPSAAWVHGAGSTPPRRCHLRPHVAHRVRLPGSTPAVLHEGVVAPAEITLISGIRVLTVTAALVDLARMRRQDTMLEWLNALMSLHPEQCAAAVEELRSRERLPGKLRAIAALESAYDEVTRYTS